MECKDHVDRQKKSKEINQFLNFRKLKEKEKEVCEVANCSIRNQKKKRDQKP